MTSEVTAPRKTGALVWIGRAISGLVVVMLLFSAVMKFQQSEEVMKEFDRLGYPADRVVPIGVTEAACTALYAIPQTAPLGAILLTGYLGGATATHVRIGDPTWFSPIIGGVLVWLGLLLRDARLRPLLPFRRM